MHAFTFRYLPIFFLWLGVAVNFAIGKTYSVSRIDYKIGNPTPQIPNLNGLLNAYVPLGLSQRDFKLGELKKGLPQPLFLSDDDLFKLGEVALHFLKDRGFEGVVAFPDPRMIDPLSGEDLRPSGSSHLNIEVWISILDELELNGSGLKKNEEGKLRSRLEHYGNETNAIGKPVSKDLLNRISKLGNHSSRKSQVLLSASDRPGYVNAQVNVTRSKSENFTFAVQNGGSPTTGRWIYNAEAKTSQLTGNDDSLSLSGRVSNTGERNAFQGKYYYPFLPGDTFGMGLALGYSSYDAQTFAVTRIDFSGHNLFGDLSFIFSSDHLFDQFGRGTMEAGLRIENVEAFNSLTRSADVTMLTPRVSFSFEQIHSYRVGKTSLSIFGNILSLDDEAMISLGGIDTNDRYARLMLAHSENFLIGKLLSPQDKYLSKHLFSFNIQSSWALSAGRHLPSHQFVAGGTGSVRGYPESPAAGDQGAFLSLEYRLPFLILPDPSHKNSLVWTIAPFIDWAQTTVNNPKDWESDHVLLATGFNVTMPLPYGFSARLAFAKPLRELRAMGNILDGTRSSDYRIHSDFRWSF